MGAFDGKRALVTGGASGIGLACATRLVHEGARTLVADMNATDGKRLAGEVGFDFVDLDVSQPAAWARLVSELDSSMGGLDIAHLNAGVLCGEGDVTKITDAQYDRIIGANLNGVFYGTRALTPLVERSGGGSIVATASLAGIIAFPPDPVYTLTKHAVVGFVRATAPQLLAKNITLNAICPSIVATPMAGVILGNRDFPGLIQPEEIGQALVDAVTSGKTGECWAVPRSGVAAAPHVFATPEGFGT